MQVSFWGVRGGIASPSERMQVHGGNTPCVAVRSRDGRWLILDAGTGIRSLGHLLMDQVPAEGPRTELALVLSHFHWDHIQGLPFFAPLWSNRFVLRIYADADPQQTERCVHHQFASPYFPVEITKAQAEIEFHKLGSQIEIAGMSVTPFPQYHPQGSTGFRIQEGSAAIVYATDTEGNHPVMEPELLRHAKDAKLLILDSQYTPEESLQRIGWGHGDWRRSCAVAGSAEVEQMLLFHHDPARTDEEIAAIVDQAKKAFPHAAAAREGMVLEIS